MSFKHQSYTHICYLNQSCEKIKNKVLMLARYLGKCGWEISSTVLPDVPGTGIRAVNNNRRLFSSLVLATEVVDRAANQMYMPKELRWQTTLLGHTFTMSHGSCIGECESSTKAAVTAFKSWMQAHEEAQVMLASVLVVVGLWWLVRTMLALLINLVCPILVVILAVMCVPQLRAPLLGQNYPLLANLLRNILLKMAETIKT